MDAETESLLKQIHSLGKNLRSSDGLQAGKRRSELRRAARQLYLALEEPGDTVERVCFQVVRFMTMENGV